MTCIFLAPALASGIGPAIYLSIEFDRASTEPDLRKWAWLLMGVSVMMNLFWTVYWLQIRDPYRRYIEKYGTFK